MDVNYDGKFYPALLFFTPFCVSFGLTVAIQRTFQVGSRGRKCSGDDFAQNNKPFIPTRSCLCNVFLPD